MKIIHVIFIILVAWLWNLPVYGSTWQPSLTFVWPETTGNLYPDKYMPMGHAPMGHAPMGHAPMGHAPMGHAPMGHAPMGHAPMGHAPMGHAPFEFYTDHFRWPYNPDKPYKHQVGRALKFEELIHEAKILQNSDSGRTAAVPEPASMILMGTGLVGLWVVRRRKKL